MSTLKGLKAGTSTITASFSIGGVTKTAKATLTVTRAAGNISYTMSDASLYCTDTAAAKSSTDTVKYASVSSSGATSSTGTVSCTISVKNSGGSAVSGWSITSDGKTITIPTGTQAGAYTVTVTATAATNADYYDSASTTKTATITVVATSISSYGAVSTPSISQKTDFPAGGVTITSANAGTYFTVGTSSQTITYNNGATRNGSISYAWSGSAKIDDLKDTPQNDRTSITISTLTYTATGEGSKSASSSVSSGYQQANILGTTHYKNTSGTAGDNWTYNNPTAVVVFETDGMVPHGGSCKLSSSVKDTKQYYRLWTSGTYSSFTDHPDGTVGFEITNVSKNSGSADYTLSGAVLTHRDMKTFVGKDTVTVQSYNTKDTSKKGTSKSWSIQNDRTKVWDGYKTYGTPVAIAVSGSDMIPDPAGGFCIVTSSVTNERYWHYEYTDYHHNEAANTRSEEVAGTVNWVISSDPKPVGGDRWGALSSTSGNSTKVSHSSMTNVVGTDSLTLEAQNSLDTTKKVSKSWSVTNSLGSTRYKDTSGTEGRNITAWGTPAKITTSGSYTAAGGSCTYSSSVTNSTSWYQRYTSGTYTPLQTGTEAGTVKWVIASETTGTNGADRWSALSATTGNSTEVTHSNMTTNIATDTIVVEAQNYNDATKKADAISLSVSNSLTWSSPVISHTTPISLAVSGQTYTMSPAITQSGSYTSGSSASNTSATYSYAVKTTVSGYSLSSSKVTVSNNNTTSARNGYTVTITATANGKSSTKDVVFNQAAGSKVYNNPTITKFVYDTFPANGATKTPSVTYSQVWTWNGVSGSGGTLTSGGTLAYTTTGDLPSGFATATGFATTGSVVWANRTTVVGVARSAKSNLKVAVTMNDLTSATYTCISCDQVANELVGLSLSLNPDTIEYGATSVPTTTATYTSGSTKNVSDLATYTSSDNNVAEVKGEWIPGEL